MSACKFPIIILQGIGAFFFKLEGLRTSSKNKGGRNINSKHLRKQTYHPIKNILINTMHNESKQLTKTII